MMAEKDIYRRVVEGILDANKGKEVLVEYHGLELIIVKGKYYPLTNEFGSNSDIPRKKDIPIS